MVTSCSPSLHKKGEPPWDLGTRCRMDNDDHVYRRQRRKREGHDTAMAEAPSHPTPPQLPFTEQTWLRCPSAHNPSVAPHYPWYKFQTNEFDIKAPPWTDSPASCFAMSWFTLYHSISQISLDLTHTPLTVFFFGFLRKHSPPLNLNNCFLSLKTQLCLYFSARLPCKYILPHAKSTCAPQCLVHNP